MKIITILQLKDVIMEDVNRIKLVLVEKNVLVNGFQNKWESIHLLCQNGAQIHHNQILLVC